MKYLIIFLIYTYSISALSDGVKIHVFKKDIAIPNNCVMYARPSVMDSHSIEYHCLSEKPFEISFYDFSNRNQLKEFDYDIINMYLDGKENPANIQRTSNQLLKVTKFTTKEKYIKRIKYHLHICDTEVCVYINTTNQNNISNFLSQL